MRFGSRVFALSLAFLPMAATAAQAPLPVAATTEVSTLRTHVERILQTLQACQASLPARQRERIEKLLEARGVDSEIGVQLQELLDPYCLVCITINPESRVKAVRGEAGAELRSGRRSVVLVKVQNDAGVTQPLMLTSPNLATPGAVHPERWLEASFHRQPPLEEELSGQVVEYLVLQLQTNAEGKREATLLFDAGQGTQDLGFRAEVPILFTIRPQ
jgi:hypothetical protein